MNLLEDVSKIIDQIETLHSNDPAITHYWNNMATLLTKSEPDTIDLLDNLDDSNQVDNISSIFEEISSIFQSANFIKCIERLEKKFPDLILKHMIESAREVIINE